MDLPADLVAELPDGLLAALELRCFAPDSSDARALGERLGAHVVSYARHRHKVGPGRVELCRTLAMAELDEDQVEQLRATEERLDMTLVAYRRPVELRASGASAAAQRPLHST